MKIHELKRKPDPDMVIMVEELLAEVKSGDVTELVIVGTNAADGSNFFSATFQDRWRLLGAIEYAKKAVDI